MKNLLPVLPREMRCKPPNAEIQHKNVDYSVVTERDIIAVVED